MWDDLFKIYRSDSNSKTNNVLLTNRTTQNKVILRVNAIKVLRMSYAVTRSYELWSRAAVGRRVSRHAVAIEKIDR